MSADPRGARAWLGRVATRSALALALVASAALTAGSAPPAQAAPAAAQTYAGPGYSSDPDSPPTRPENQSKHWFHAGAWWALLLEPAGRTVRVHELMPDHTWRPTSGVVTTDAGDYGDALHDGDTVHVVSRHTDAGLYYVRLTFDPATRDYVASAPVLVDTHGAFAPATIAEDTTGRLWVGYATAVRVVVTYSDDGVVWAPNVVVSRRDAGVTAETAAVISYDDRIGVLWSDQSTGSFQFASHQDGTDPLLWSYEVALTGENEADDHINLRRVDGDPSDTLVAAVKTSQGDRGGDESATLIKVLMRAPGGTWTALPVGTVGDGLTDAVLQVDQATRTLHLFAAHERSIVTKQASLDDPQFPAGIGSLFMLGVEGNFLNPATSKDPADARSGLIVLAHDGTSQTYRHAEMPITSPTPPPPDPGDVTPPDPPALVQGRVDSSGSVTLTWPEVTETERWAPARNGVPAAGYVVLRDGVEVGTVTTTSAVDEPAAAGSSAGSVEYQVLAVDAAGNRSAPAAAVVDLAAERPGAGNSSIGRWLLALAGLFVVLALCRLLLHVVATRRRPAYDHRFAVRETVGLPDGTAPGDPEPPASPEQRRVEVGASVPSGRNGQSERTPLRSGDER